MQFREWGRGISIFAGVGAIEEADQVGSRLLVAAAVNAHCLLDHFSQFLVITIVLQGFLNQRAFLLIRGS